MSKTVGVRRPWGRMAEAMVLPRSYPETMQGGRVVVASEDAQLRRRLAAVLAGDGREVIEARTYLDLLRHTGLTGPSLRLVPRPDALVLDLSGRSWARIDVLDLVCSSDWAFPVIALVAKDDENARAEASRLAVRAVLDLPVDEATLRAELMDIIPPETPLRGAA